MEMFSKKWFKVLFMLCLCVVVAAGCRTKSKKTVGGEEDLTVNPPGNGTTEVLPERTTDAGTPVAEKFETVLFAYDSFQVADAEAAKIVKVGEFMKSNADVKLTTDGHCDERGSAEYNMSLGEHRALAVRAYLVGLGIDAARIQTKSFGRETPVDARHCEEAWRQNRRVEFSLSR
jgi:peptidoglycan-associated lipoprotein